MNAYLRFLFVLLLAAVLGGCRSRDYSYREYRRLELETLASYRNAAAIEAVADMERLYEYGAALCSREDLPNAESMLAVIAARKAFLHNHLGHTGLVQVALAQCQTHLRDIVVRGESDSHEGRLRAFLNVVVDFDRGLGAKWGPLSDLVAESGGKGLAEGVSDEMSTEPSPALCP